MIASAPAAKAFAISPENFIPPSAISVVLLLPIPFFTFSLISTILFSAIIEIVYGFFKIKLRMLNL